MIEVKTFIVSLVIGLLILSVQELRADSSFDYEEFRKDYFRLRNIDPEYQKSEEWNQVFKRYSEQYQNSANKLPARFYLDFSTLLLEIQNVRSENDFLAKSVEVLDKLVEYYPKSEFADDARLKQIHVFELLGASAEDIRNKHQHLIEQYPESDSAQVAKAKIAAQLEPANQIVSAGQQIPELPIVILDPGHGGEDFGATSELGLFEKDVALSISLEIEKILLSQRIAKPILTRRSDVFLPLKHRVDLANKSQAEVFISIHSNASPKRNQKGITTYILDKSSDEATRLLVERENRDSGEGEMSDLSYILDDLIQQTKNPKSEVLAELLNKQLGLLSDSNGQRIKNNKLKRAPFFVLLRTQMPSVLLELMFIDHQDDAEQLADPEFRSQLAQALAQGIKQFLGQK